MRRAIPHALWLLLALAPARLAAAPEHARPVASALQAEVAPADRPDDGTDPAWTAYAHARLALEARARGDEATAIQELQHAAQLDPQWASPHFSLAWYYLKSDPGTAPSELAQGVGLWLESFRNQNMLVFHLVLWGILSAFLALALVAASAVVTALPETHHRATEFLSGYLENAYASVIAALLLALPFAMGAGLLLPLLLLLALQQHAISGNGRRVWSVLLVAALVLPWAIRETDSLLLPRTPQSWVGRVSLASRTRWNNELASALRETEAQAPGRYEVPFAHGLMALRDQRFNEALAQLRRADSLSHGDARVLNDLGVAYWMLGRGFAAESAFTSATHADERLTAAHYNLAQVLSRRLAFDDANREMLRAGALDFDRLRRHFDANGAGRSAMMIEEPSPSSLWHLWRDETTERADWTESPLWLTEFWESRTLPFAAAAVVVLILGSFLGRRLRRWLPVHNCVNCGSLLCRRCSGRRKGETLCQVCLEHLTSTRGGPFARVLLERRRTQISRERGLTRMVLSVLLPPLGRALDGRWALSTVEWFVLSFLTLASVRGGFWIHAGPNFAAGLGSAPTTALLVCAWAVLWGPMAAREYLRFRRRRDPGGPAVHLASLDEAA